MSFDWAEYFYLAQELNGTPTMPYSEEAKLRAIISRAYYAAFCQARNHLRDTTSYIPSRTKDTHWEVITHFRDNRNSERRKIGQDLGRLFEYRKQADYEDDYRGSLPINTQTALTLTGRILTRLARLE